MKSYIEGHRESGIKVGDKVRVTRKAESHEGGWGTVWYEGDFDEEGNGMTDFVGEVLYVTADEKTQGFGCGQKGTQGNYAFPYFVLEKI